MNKINKRALALLLSALLLPCCFACEKGEPAAATLAPTTATAAATKTAQASPEPTPAPTAEPTPAPTAEPIRAVKGYDFNEPAEFSFDLSDMRYKASDGSYIAWTLIKSETEIAVRPMEDYVLSLAEGYAKTFDGIRAEHIALEEYEQGADDDASSYLHAVYTLRPPKGAPLHVLERLVQTGDTVYRVRFVDATKKDVWMDAFRKSENTVRVLWEDEATAQDISKLVLYDSGEGFAICMPKKMARQDMDGFTAFYHSDEYMLSALRENFSDYAAVGMDVDAFSLADYAALIAEANGLTTGFRDDAFGNLVATYVNTVQSGTFFYYTTVRKGTDAFWVVTFACTEAQQDEYESQFALWASTIQVQ